MAHLGGSTHTKAPQRFLRPLVLASHDAVAERLQPVGGAAPVGEAAPVGHAAVERAADAAQRDAGVLGCAAPVGLAAARAGPADAAQHVSRLPRWLCNLLHARGQRGRYGRSSANGQWDSHDAEHVGATCSSSWNARCCGPGGRWNARDGQFRPNWT